MLDFKNGKIYKLVCNETGMVYYGHTAQKYLSTRLAIHKSHYKRYLAGKASYCCSFKIIEKGNFYIVLLFIL